MNQIAPRYQPSNKIKRAEFDPLRIHKGDGDMWPLTWAADGNLYAGAGDNTDSPMNVWKVCGHPEPHHSWGVSMWNVNNMPVDPAIYCQRPHVDAKRGVKPAGLLSLDGVLYLAAELHNYGEDPDFRRQQNVSAWIIASHDFGITWDLAATPLDFFTGRFSSPHFIQYGKDYLGARDDFIYASFSAGVDGNSYWENGDMLLLGRAPKDSFLERKAWEFFVGADERNRASWSRDGQKAQAIFSYHHMTGENHIAYNAGLGCYLMGNYGFIDALGNPRPYHQAWPESAMRSQLTLYEAPEPWGPWSIFYRNDDWAKLGGYQPNFPTKWMSEDGRTVWMVYSGSYEDYNFVIQKVTLVTS